MKPYNHDTSLRNFIAVVATAAVYLYPTYNGKQNRLKVRREVVKLANEDDLRMTRERMLQKN